jgi:hypothetical protein
MRRNASCREASIHGLSEAAFPFVIPKPRSRCHSEAAERRGTLRAILVASDKFADMTSHIHRYS